MSAQTVNPLSIVFMVVSFLLCFGVPVGLAVWAKVRYRKAFSFLPLLLGVVGFTLFQIVLRVGVLLPLFNSTAWVKSIQPNTWQLWAYIGILCVTAGLFEEPVRFAAYAILRKHRRFADGLSYGIGHGGVEAILLVGLAYVNNIVYSVMINTGAFGPMVQALPEAVRPQMEAARQALVTYSPDTFLMGGLERVFTMAVQIALSVLVLKGFAVNRKWLYLVLATALHALIDFVAVALQTLHVHMWLIETAVFAMAVLSMLYILGQARKWPKGLEPTPAGEAAPPEPSDG